jgi:ATPase family associated with various cellular activities (AAA)
MDSKSEQFSFCIPRDFKEKDILFKTQTKKEKIVQPLEKFRSFFISMSNNGISVFDNGMYKNIKICHLFEILKNHGLSPTIPMEIESSPEFSFIDFDWKPHSFNMPTVWDFNWNGVRCGITSDGVVHCRKIWFRVFDMTLGVGEKIMEEIAKELLIFWTDKTVVNTSLTVYTTSQNSMNKYVWTALCTKRCRDIDTIYIDQAVKTKLINQLKKFYTIKDLYDRFCITWKRIHLFHGPPGSGKTSTILSIASLFKKNIAKFTITPLLNSQDLESLFSSFPKETFLLLEDVDSLFTKREGTNSLDFSTLLNCLDGLTTVTGLVVFMTTNHKMKLDDAFTRPGRVDCDVEFKLPGRSEMEACLKVLGSEFSHQHKEFLDSAGEMSIAALQKHLFDCIMEERKSILYT